MYPHKLMPDPEGAERLLKHGCKVYYAKDELETAAKLKSPDDSEGQDNASGRRPGQTRAKMVKKPIWLVTIVVPRKFMNDIEASRLRIEDQAINSDAVEQANVDTMSQPEGGE
jgi:ribosomal protein L19E